MLYSRGAHPSGRFGNIFLGAVYRAIA